MPSVNLASPSKDFTSSSSKDVTAKTISSGSQYTSGIPDSPSKDKTLTRGHSANKYNSGIRPAPIVTAPVPQPHIPSVSHPSMVNAQLLPGHESFIICPGQKPVKVTHAQTVSYYWPDSLIRVRYNKYLLYRPYATK